MDLCVEMLSIRAIISLKRNLLLILYFQYLRIQQKWFPCFLCPKSKMATRADQNTGGALLESPMRTAIHRKSRVSFAMSVELN